MSYDAPWDIAKGHHHLATPEFDRWKAAQQGHAAVSPTLAHTQNGFVIYILPADLEFVLAVAFGLDTSNGPKSPTDRFLVVSSVILLCHSKNPKRKFLKKNPTHARDAERPRVP